MTVERSSLGYEQELRMAPEPFLIGMCLPALFLSLNIWQVPHPAGAGRLALLMYAAALAPGVERVVRFSL